MQRVFLFEGRPGSCCFAEDYYRSYGCSTSIFKDLMVAVAEPVIFKPVSDVLPSRQRRRNHASD